MRSRCGCELGCEGCAVGAALLPFSPSPLLLFSSSPLSPPLLSLHRLAGRGLPGGNSLFFASPKKSKQKKGDPKSGSLRFATGNLRCSTTAGSKTTRFAQTSFCPDPPTSALLGPATRGSPEHQKPIPKTNTEPNTKQGHAMACPCGFRYSFLVSGCLVFRHSGPLCMRRGAQVQTEKGKNVSERSELFLTPSGPSTAGRP